MLNIRLPRKAKLYILDIFALSSHKEKATQNTFYHLSYVITQQLFLPIDTVPIETFFLSTYFAYLHNVLITSSLKVLSSRQKRGTER